MKIFVTRSGVGHTLIADSFPLAAAALVVSICPPAGLRQSPSGCDMERHGFAADSHNTGRQSARAHQHPLFPQLQQRQRTNGNPGQQHAGVGAR